MKIGPYVGRPAYPLCMVQHWSPMSEIMRSPVPGEWIMFDGRKKIAILREMRIGPKKELLIRSVTYDVDPAERALIGYFPHMRMAAEMTWDLYRRQGRVEE